MARGIAGLLEWRARPRALVLLLGGVAVLVMVGSIGSGAMGLSWRETVEALWNFSGTGAARNHAVVWNLRLPRTLMAFAAGGALGLCGAALQGLFRNPLADPALIGISGGGALGAVCAIVFGLPAFFGKSLAGSLYAVPLAAFAGAFCATATVYQVAAWQGRVRVATLLLAGVAVNAVSIAGIGWFTFIATDAQLRELTFWSLGSVGGATWKSVGGCAPFVLAALLVLPGYARALNALSLGEANAVHMGIAIEPLKRGVGIVTALAVGAVVAFTGTIGFIGLIAPHLFRMAGGPDHRWALPGSFLIGGCLLCAADVVARVAVAPAEIPVGIVAATVGAPFFLFLLIREKRGGFE